MATAPVQIPSDPPPVILNQDQVDPAAPPAAVDLIEPVDEFAKMFASFSKEEPKPGEPPVAVDPAVTARTPETVATEAVADPAKVAADAAAAAAAAAPAPAPAPAPDPMERLADLLTQRQPAPQPTLAPRASDPAPIYSQEEATALNEFYKDWPEIARAQELALRLTATQVTNHVFTEVARVLGPKLKLLDALADNMQYDTIERKVPDYTTIQDKVVAWVEKQPAYLKDAYTGVMRQGTADEITDLINRYRTETGMAAPTAAPGLGASQFQSPVQQPPALSPAAKQAAARLAPVSGKRTVPPQGTPTTFEDAFDQFAKTG